MVCWRLLIRLNILPKRFVVCQSCWWRCFLAWCLIEVSLHACQSKYGQHCVRVSWTHLSAYRQLPAPPLYCERESHHHHSEIGRDHEDSHIVQKSLADGNKLLQLFILSNGPELPTETSPDPELLWTVVATWSTPKQIKQHINNEKPFDEELDSSWGSWHFWQFCITSSLFHVTTLMQWQCQVFRSTSNFPDSPVSLEETAQAAYACSCAARA